MFDRILMPSSPETEWEGVAPYGVAVAEAFEADVVVLSVMDKPQQRDQIRADQETAAREATEPAMQMLEQANVPAEREIRDGEAEEEILDFIVERDIDLVVMGTHARTGVEAFLHDSVAESVIEESPVPVMTITPGAAASATK